MSFTVGQQQLLAILPKITGFISASSSLCITILILRDKTKRSKVYHRLILGMSCADISSSLWLAMSTWPIPKETGILWAVGNTTSCTFQGFFTQFGISSPLYNVSLSCYYLFAVRYSWKEAQLKRIEPWFHVFPLLWAGATAIAGLFLKIFNSANLWCWIASYPGRHEDTNVFRWALFYGPLWFAISLVSVNLVLVFAKVRTVMLESDHWLHPSREFQIEDTSSAVHTDTFQGSASAVPGGGLLSLANSLRRFSLSGREEYSSSANRRLSQSISMKRSGKVFYQCLRYALALYWTWIPLTLVRIFQTIEKPPVYALYVLAAMNTPMQGLPNFLVYVYPMMMEAKQLNPQNGFWLWLKISVMPRALRPITQPSHQPSQQTPQQPSHTSILEHHSNDDVKMIQSQCDEKKSNEVIQEEETEQEEYQKKKHTLQ